jgi:hypothetical protein
MRPAHFAARLLLPVFLLAACVGRSAGDGAAGTDDEGEALASSAGACQEACRRRNAFEQAYECLDGTRICPLVGDGKGHYGPICGDLEKEADETPHAFPYCGFPFISSLCTGGALDKCITSYRADLKKYAERTFDAELGGLCSGAPAATNLSHNAAACSAYNGDPREKELWSLIQGYIDPGPSTSCWKPCK